MKHNLFDSMRSMKNKKTQVNDGLTKNIYKKFWDKLNTQLKVLIVLSTVKFTYSTKTDCIQAHLDERMWQTLHTELETNLIVKFWHKSLKLFQTY